MDLLHNWHTTVQLRNAVVTSVKTAKIHLTSLFQHQMQQSTKNGRLLTKMQRKLDFSENASLLMQNEIQSAHWNHSQATLFTAHAWMNQDCKESIVIISDDLNHTNSAVHTFMLFLYKQLTIKYKPLKTLTPLVMELHPSSSSSTCFQTYIDGNKTLKQISFGIFLQRRMERGLLMVQEEQ